MGKGTDGAILVKVAAHTVLAVGSVIGRIVLDAALETVHRHLVQESTSLLDLLVDFLPHMEVGAVMLLEIAFKSQQVGELPQCAEQRIVVLHVCHSLFCGNGDSLNFHIQNPP